jgi:hypothetical protein
MILYNEKLHNLYSSRNIRGIKSRRLRCEEHAEACMAITSDRTFIGKAEVKELQYVTSRGIDASFVLNRSSI